MIRSSISWALVVLALASIARADDPPPEPKGNFISSLKQSFKGDPEREIVRGHFDIDTHRYYCLVDPKSGKADANGVAGNPVPKKDGTTGIQNAAVSFYNCSDAETKGLLVTDGYTVPVKVLKAPAPARAPAAPAAVAPALAAVPVVEDHATKFNTADPTATLQGFIEVYNSGDGAELPGLLAASADFAWVQPDGHTVWGHEAASEALHYLHAAGSQLQLQSQDGHTISPAPKTAILLAKLRMTQNAKDARVIRCSAVMVQGSKGWRIVSLSMTPEV